MVVAGQGSSLQEELEAAQSELARLRAQLGNFGLVWQDRPEGLEADIAAVGAGLALQPDRHFGSFDTPAHMLIEGDNLLALSALAHGLSGEVDVIYADPPYNTGNTSRTGFTYSDRFRSTEDVERHSTWLSMMRRRLELARALLKSTGVLMLSIDDNEVHHLRVLCDQVFGEHNFIAQMVWDGGNVKNNARFIAGSHEYVLIYARSAAALVASGVRWREPRPGVDLMRAQHSKLLREHGSDYTAMSAAMKAWVRTAPLSKRLKVFTGVDARGLYTPADLSAPGGKGGRYEVAHPVTGRPCRLPSRGWGCTEVKMRALVAQDRVLFGLDETTQPMRKLYLDDRTDQVRRSILDYPARSSTHLLEHMLGRRSAFNNPKNLAMITDLLALVAPSDALVVDFFAGSGTTGHAVLALNASDGGRRRFVLVTNNENDICHQVTYPRLVAAMSGNWANGRTEPALGGGLIYATAAHVHGGNAAKALDGLVAATVGRIPSRVGPLLVSCAAQRSVAAWDGRGSETEVLDALASLTASAGPELLLLDASRRPFAAPGQALSHRLV